MNELQPRRDDAKGPAHTIKLRKKPGTHIPINPIAPPQNSLTVEVGRNNFLRALRPFVTPHPLTPEYQSAFLIPTFSCQVFEWGINPPT